MRRQKGSGVELEVDWKPATDWYVKLGYVWQQVEDADTGIQVADAPKQSLDFMINWQVSAQSNLRMDNHWIAGRAREVGDLRADIDNYFLTHLAWQYRFDQQLDVRLSVKNLFDIKAATPAQSVVKNDYPMARRGMWLDFSYRW